ncbi:DUF3632 domain-containing protein [Aspergillus affinis]|uniref:DUF3632 domain-containing protein n=1 Tax=Aspergillus affinis TaxID=1070780 RepID=UPI0022FEDFCB|nr:uncharacterized protein KD926_002590 [Aspergillus affinis]KAI9035925.1 hypothetical protein KD926_002590 [Aspergillus affinis]
MPSRDSALAGRASFIKTIESSEEFKILDKFVHYPEARVEGYVNQIIDQCNIAMIIDDKYPEEGVANVDTNLCWALLELAQRLPPSKQTKLVQMLAELQTRTVMHPVTGQPLTYQGDVLFTDLPASGWSELEAFDEHGGDWHDITDPDMDPECQDRWVNLNAFVAQMSQAAELREPFNDSQKVHRMDRSLRAIWVMREALENDTRPLEELVESAAMRAACMWFIYAADRLRQKVDFQVRYPDLHGAPGSKYADKGWRGHELERWIMWMQRLNELKAVCASYETERLIEIAQENIFRVMPPCDFDVAMKDNRTSIIARWPGDEIP